eukprot:2158700-Rhodomonas_salina.1
MRRCGSESCHVWFKSDDDVDASLLEEPQLRKRRRGRRVSAGECPSITGSHGHGALAAAHEYGPQAGTVTY